MKCTFYKLGLIDYEEAYDLQKRFWAEKTAGKEDDILLLLEHKPTLTLGKSGKLKNLLIERDELADKKIPLYFTDRGGDITYHGPGQLVAYPIVDLRKRGKDIHRYINDLQEAVIGTLADFSIVGEKDQKHVGVWVGKDKVCAIGVAVHQWITMHGLALNVDPDLNSFSLITPCGIVGRGVTSMAKLGESAPSMEEVTIRFIAHFSRVFSLPLEPGSVDQLRL
ncbi:MAG: lipoyl(octanoyl) transferase [Deltaproteobacteria bacterium RBG_13_43_22]|nr:MAG: lipoyl(octanoyl) transferase [Deltaproteobacteria bacterium RBG_13_43_22]